MALRATPDNEKGDRCLKVLQNDIREGKWPVLIWWIHPERQSGLADVKRTSDWCYQARKVI